MHDGDISIGSGHQLDTPGVAIALDVEELADRTVVLRLEETLVTAAEPQKRPETHDRSYALALVAVVVERALVRLVVQPGCVDFLVARVRDSANPVIRLFGQIFENRSEFQQVLPLELFDAHVAKIGRKGDTVFDRRHMYPLSRYFVPPRGLKYGGYLNCIYYTTNYIQSQYAPLLLILMHPIVAYVSMRAEDEFFPQAT